MVENATTFTSDLSRDWHCGQKRLGPALAVVHHKITCRSLHMYILIVFIYSGHWCGTVPLLEEAS